jgi:HlyD family secretion protein
MLKYILPAIAVVGLLFGLYVVKTGAKAVPVASPAAEPSRPPFKHYIAGAGIVEASTENIEISTPIPGMVTEIPVHVEQQVNTGELLFKLDTRDLEAELKVRQAGLELAKAKIPESEANVGDMSRQLELYQAVSDPRAITAEELSKRKFAVTAAQSRLAQARADVLSYEAQIAQTQTDIDRRHITAPVSGEVLQLKVNVRTDIDENDAWRFQAGAKAIAYVRGNPKLFTPLTFTRVEPYVVPKKSLTGDTTERVDTRVLQVLYGFPHDQLKVYVGQQMDVYIDVPEEAPTASPTTATTTGKD